MQPLSGRLDDQRRALVVGDAGVGLQVRVLLPRGGEPPAQHEVGLGEAGLDVAAADLLVQQHVRAALGVDQRRIGRQRRVRVAHQRQVGVADLDQRGGPCRQLRRRRDDQRDPVADVAHDLAAQHFLVGVDQAVAVVRHVGRGQHRDDTVELARAARVDALDPRVRAVGEDGLAVQHLRPHQVGRVARGAGDLGARIGPRDRAADQAHSLSRARRGRRTAAGCGSCARNSWAAPSIASRILR